MKTLNQHIVPSRKQWLACEDTRIIIQGSLIGFTYNSDIDTGNC